MSVFKHRIRRIRKSFDACDESLAMVVSSAPSTRKSRDTYYPYRQDSDFYYLTGSRAQDTALIISSKKRAPILVAPKPDPIKLLWDGPPPNMRQLAASLGAELILTDNPRKEILTALRGIETLYYQNTPQSTGWLVAEELARIPSHERSKLPNSFRHTDLVIEKLRCHKEPSEIKLIRKAAKVSNIVLHLVSAQIHPGMKESDIANTIEYFIKMSGCDVAFQTIVASGPSASVLHYHAHSRSLRKGEMVLIDWGAEFEMYAADLTRTIPVDGKFSAQQKELYSIVLEAQHAAIKSIRPGVKIGTVYNAAARVITEGLVDVGVLRGKVSALISKKAFKPYFPHGIGHTLGLDVHDIGSVRGNNDAILTKGMVITIEPGLYFSKRTGNIPQCGIRIEDDVLVTARGCEVLSAGYPKEPLEVENLFAAL